MKLRTRWPAATGMLVGVLVLAACTTQTPDQEEAAAPDQEEATTPDGDGDVDDATDAPDAAEEGPTVGIFVDNAFGDRAFFDIALDGQALIEEQFAATVRTYEGQLQADTFVPLLGDAGAANELVFVLGFEAIDAMLQAAERDPDTLYVFIDAPVEGELVSSVFYRDQEYCFLAGAMAAMMTADTSIPDINEQKVIGFLGGVDAPVIRRCEAGYRQGAAHVDPEVEVVTAFVGSFVDPARGKEINLSLVDQGADIVMQYAGLSGEGGFDAAQEAPMYAIGAGFDQSWLAPGRVPASALKRVDITIELVAERYLGGEFGPGVVMDLGLAEGGLAMVYDEELVDESVRDLLSELETQIIAGEIEVDDGT